MENASITTNYPETIKVILNYINDFFSKNQGKYLPYLSLNNKVIYLFKKDFGEFDSIMTQLNIQKIIKIKGKNISEITELGKEYLSELNQINH